jgi:hypothetical protein
MPQQLDRIASVMPAAAAVARAGTSVLAAREDSGEVQRHEGNGAGDGVRLRERRTALKGATPGADPA